MEREPQESDGYRWQAAAADKLKEWKPSLVVETGISYGVSTLRFLQALDEINQGTLVSIDIGNCLQIAHPRWRFLLGTSLEMLPRAFLEHGPFDVFIHDSDHDAECQTFEYETAWHLVRPGGHILSDDITWGGHDAWLKFLARHGLTVHSKLGHAGLVQKPSDGPAPPTDEAQLREVIQQANALSHDFARSVNEKPKYFLDASYP